MSTAVALLIDIDSYLKTFVDNRSLIAGLKTDEIATDCQKLESSVLSGANFNLYDKNDCIERIELTKSFASAETWTSSLQNVKFDKMTVLLNMW